MADATPPADRAERARLTRRIVRMRGHLAVLRKRLPLAGRLATGCEHAAMSVMAAILAWAPTTPLGLQEGFWGAITALGVVQTEFGASRSTARDQCTGAAVGGAIGVAVALAFGQPVWAYALAVFLSVVVCWAANVSSAARLAGVTATIILLVPHRGSPERMMLTRVCEVGWGVAVALAVVWSATWLRRLLTAPAPRGDARR